MKASYSIRETLASLIDRGYSPSMIKQVLEENFEEKQTDTAEWLTDNGITYCSNCKYEVWGSGLSVLPEWKHCPCCGRKIAE